MHVKAHLDVDMVAVETTDKISLMVDLTAPIGDAQKTRPGQAVQVVLDRSGSMTGDRLESAKVSLLRLLDRLAPQDSFGLVAFDDQALVIAPMRTMADHNLPALKKVIREMNTGGSTDLSAGYFLGLRELARANTNNGATLLLISDGHANAGEKDPKYDRDNRKGAGVKQDVKPVWARGHRIVARGVRTWYQSVGRSTERNS